MMDCIFRRELISSKASLCLLVILVWSAGALATDASLDRGRTYLRNGQYALAVEVIAGAREHATTPAERGIATAMLGIAHFYLHHRDVAKEFLEEALKSPGGKASERARWTATLAELAAGRGDMELASRGYVQAMQLARNDADMVTDIRLNHLASLPPEKQWDELTSLQRDIAAIRNSDDRLRAYLMAGTQARSLGAKAARLAYEDLVHAQGLATEPRPRAEVLGQLAQLYEDQRRWTDALRLNAEAMASAKRIEGRDLLMDLSWRAARLYRAKGQNEDALAAYQEAVDHLEAIREDIPVEYREGRSSFRETLEPVYLGLADLLLSKASRLPLGERVPVLRRAREVVELSKQAELEDFLGGRCAVKGTKLSLVEAIAPQTAVLYPIILPDRLELLASVGSELQQSTQAISGETVRAGAQRLATSLRNRSDAAPQLGKDVYAWLVQPLESWFKEKRVQTLVIVPDGALRLVPLSALHDGEQFLIERYAIATSPGLTLQDPTPLGHHGTQALLAGLSEPGPAVEQLPPDFQRDLLGGDVGAPRGRPNRALRGVASGHAFKRGAIPLRDPKLIEQLREELRLPGVLEELKNLQQTLPNTVLLNEAFTVDAFRSGVGKPSVGVVHVASHGVFGHSAESTFIMAYDRLLKLDELEQILKGSPSQRQRIDLLTLSACQTAEGDDRAPLGFTGVALKTRVRGAMGTLWPVDDEAAAKLMPEFYGALTSGKSKVVALREAQLKLLHTPELRHPYFWSPFILVGNWL